MSINCTARLRATVCAFALVVGLVTTAAQAQSERRSFNVEPQPLASALLQFGGQAAVSVLVRDEAARELRTNGVKGTLPVNEALAALLAGSGLQFEFSDAKTVRVFRPGLSSALPKLQNVPVSAAPLPNVQAPPEELVVTGSRIRGAAPAGSELIRIDRADIERQGFTTTTDILRSLPQNNALGPTDVATTLFGNAGSIQNAGSNYSAGTSVNLRGLGSNATLVLVNGRRIAPASGGNFFDLSTIPLSAVERVEVLADGASAIYGSDAVGGVVNVVLRKNFQGAETGLRYTTMDGGGARRQASQLLGTSWDTGKAVLTYQYDHRDSLNAAERPYARYDLRPFGGTDMRPQLSNPGNIVGPDGRFYAIPAGQDGRHLTAAQLVAGTQNVQDILLTGYEIIPTSTSHTAYLHVDQNVGDRLTLFGDVNFNNRSQRSNAFAAITATSVPRSNPFFVSPVPGASSVTVYYNFFRDLPPPVNTATDVAVATAFGASYQLPSDWKAELTAQYAKDTIGYTAQSLSSPALARALADSNPATALNLFGDGSNNNPATLATLYGVQAIDVSYLYRGGQLTADGPLFDLPGGPVRAALGFEGRQERSHNVIRSSLSSDTVVQRPATDLARDVLATYAEINLPVFSDKNAIPFVRKLDLSLAARSEHYTGFGYTTNPKAGASWEPFAGVTLRGSYGHSFKAPVLSDMNPAGNSVQVFQLSDPKSPTGTTQALVLQGGRANLRPEKAKTWSIGGEWRPAEVKGLALDATYFKIDYTNRVGRLNINSALALDAQNGALVQRDPSAAEIARLFADPGFIGGVLPSSNIKAIVDARTSNLAKQLMQGLDLHGSYGFETLGGTLTFDGGATILFKDLTAVTANSPLASTLNLVNSPTRYRARGGATFERDGGSIGLFANYVGGYDNTLVTPRQRVDSWTTLDLSLAYNFESAQFPAWLQGTRVSVTMFNIADLDPPFVNVTGGYDVFNANVYGRQIAFFLSKKF